MVSTGVTHFCLSICDGLVGPERRLSLFALCDVEKRVLLPSKTNIRKSSSVIAHDYVSAYKKLGNVRCGAPLI